MTSIFEVYVNKGASKLQQVMSDVQTLPTDKAELHQEARQVAGNAAAAYHVTATRPNVFISMCSLCLPLKVLGCCSKPA